MLIKPATLSQDLTNSDALTQDQQTQRLAIYNGLRGIFTEEEANIALEKWVVHFYDTGSVFNGINGFARDICETLNKKGQHRELVKAINFALMNKTVNTTHNLKLPEEKSVSEITPALAEPMGIVETSYDQEINTPDFQTFQQLLLKIIQLSTVTHPNLSVDLTGFLNELVASMAWAEAQQQQVLDVIAVGHTRQVRAYRADQLKTFLKHLRAWFIAETSVVEMNQLFSQAIAEVDATDAGIRYSAKSFM